MLHRGGLALGMALAMMLPHALHADEMVFYRCTDAAGTTTVQNQPCPAGSTEQQRRTVATPPTRNAPPPPPAQAAPTNSRMPSPEAIQALQQMQGQSGVIGSQGVLDSAVPSSSEDGSGLLDSNAIVPVDDSRPPLPPIFRCSRGDGSQYTHEYTEAAPICEPIRTVQLDGQPNPGGMACEVRRDTCEQISTERACGAWQQRLRDARGSARFARADQKAALDTEVARLQEVIGASGCPLP